MAKSEYPWKTHHGKDNRLHIVTNDNAIIASCYYSREAEERFNYIVRLVTNDRVRKSLNKVKYNNNG
jgi:hypothetical protein